MYSKRGSYTETIGGEIPAAKRLRMNLADLFLTNQISGQRAQTIFEDGAEAGAQHMADLAKAGGHGRHANHIHRDLLRRLLKRNQWPPLYWADVRLWNPAKQREETHRLPMLLPHEILRAFAGRSATTEGLLSQECMASGTKEHIRRVCAELGVDCLIGCAIWADGVPFNFDRSQSMDVVSFLLPGLGGKHEHLRVPLFCINHKHCLTHKTWDDFYSVMRWSFAALASGTMPAVRHDGQAWLKTDAFRKAKSNQVLLVKGCLAEFRSDWKYLKEAFRFPQHNELAGICFLCRARPVDIPDVGLQAGWRSQPLDHWSLLHRIAQQGHSLCPLFGCPGFRSSCCKLDWLHIADQGVTADFLGNLLYYLVDKMAGPTKEMRCQNLFLEIEQWYQLFRVTARFDNLTLSMLRKGSASPKLRGKAAEVRMLVPFGHAAAQKYLSDQIPKEKTMKEAMVHLQSCYVLLSRVGFCPSSLAEQGRKFCLLASALHTFHDGVVWRVKPKMHLFLHLCESGSNPSQHWLYRDEDFGGSLASIGKRRGGANYPAVLGKSVLSKFIASHSLPLID